MSSSDDEVHSAVEGLLQKYEREEAAVLRRELVEFLKTAEARAQIEQAVRKPVEDIVLAALAHPKFQEQVRDTVITSLKPEITKAVQAVLNDVKVTISPETQAQMRRDAEDIIRNARMDAQRSALAAAQSRPGGVSRTDKIILGVFVAVVVIAALWFWVSRWDRATPSPVNTVQTETVTTPAYEATTMARAESRLLASYLSALDLAGPRDLPKLSGAELTCLDSAIRQVEGYVPLDVARLRALLNGCDALAGQPRQASRIVAGVQAQLTEESRTGSCRALQPVATDGRHGTKTSAALSTYVDCTGPAGVPTSLNTLGDYAAVGMYFIEKRMRDAG